MAGILYDSIVYGPVSSRRFGISLGINVLPEHMKFCSFDCIYCEVGWKSRDPDHEGMDLFNSRTDIHYSLEQRLIDLNEREVFLDSITFSGNGEPTMHPEFAGIMEDTDRLRGHYMPDASLTVLSNSTTLDNPAVFASLMKNNNNVMKLDAGSEYLFRLINQPVRSITLEKIVKNLKRFNGNLIIQSMFLRGEHLGRRVDNTTTEEVGQWLGHIRQIAPRRVMLYSIDRATPIHTIEKVPREELQQIAEKVRAAGIDALSYS
ncbi:MAG: radical SAM protein [Bacteroidales bacterium]